MNKVIEVDFLPKEADADFSWLIQLTNPRGGFWLLITTRTAPTWSKFFSKKQAAMWSSKKTILPGPSRAARNFRPDLIFLDVVMPEQRRRRNCSTNSGRSRIAKHTYHFPHSARYATEARLVVHIDGHPFLAKPVDIQELIKRHRRAFARACERPSAKAAHGDSLNRCRVRFNESSLRI